MERRDHKLGLVTLCLGGAQGIAPTWAGTSATAGTAATIAQRVRDDQAQNAPHP